MAWLLRLVVVLVTWAAGSAENVIDMKVAIFNPLCAPYRLLHIASTVNADVLLLPCVKAASQQSKWALETRAAVPARSFIVWGGDFNSGFGLHQDGTRWDKGAGSSSLVEHVHHRARPWSSSCICVRCFGFLDLSARFCHKFGHPELEAVPDTFHGRETGAHKNVSGCEALRFQDEEDGKVFWGWARNTSAQIKAAASLECSGGLDLGGRAPPCRKPGEAPVQLGGRDGVGLATFSRTELLEHRGTAVRYSVGAAPSKFAGSIIHTVASAVSDPSIIWKMNWKLISNSKYVEKHSRYSYVEKHFR